MISTNCSRVLQMRPTSRKRSSLPGKEALSELILPIRYLNWLLHIHAGDHSEQMNTLKEHPHYYLWRKVAKEPKGTFLNKLSLMSKWLPKDVWVLEVTARAWGFYYVNTHKDTSGGRGVGSSNLLTPTGFQSF